jgi:transcriptional regulator with XRE-family HTH domain
MDDARKAHWSKVIGANVAALRKRAGVTQSEVATRTGMSVPGMSRLESGEHFPSLATLIAVAEAIGVSPCRLIELPPVVPPKPRRKP